MKDSGSVRINAAGEKVQLQFDREVYVFDIDQARVLARWLNLAIKGAEENKGRREMGLKLYDKMKEVMK